MDVEPGQSEAEATGAPSSDTEGTARSAGTAGAARSQRASNGKDPDDATVADPAATADGAGKSSPGKSSPDGDPGDDPDGADGKGDGEDDGGKPTGKRKRSLWRELLIVVVAALVLTILIKAFLVQVFSIPSASMENTLQVGDRILVNRLIYHLRGVARGDVIVFSGDGSWGPPPPPAPSNPIARTWDDMTSLVGISVPGTDYVKRVIGLPGDHVVCCDSQGRVTVNGVALTEQSYLYPGDVPSQIPVNIVVPPGHVYVLGDHRSDSADSRYHKADPGEGTIPENEIVGRAFVIIWPPSRMGDIPIPNTFQQAALTSATAAINYGPAVAGGSAAAGVLVW